MSKLYSVVEDGEEIAGGSVASLYGAALLWSERPEQRKVNQIIPPSGEVVREVAGSELRDVIRTSTVR
jgi:hypothetical protein